MRVLIASALLGTLAAAAVLADQPSADQVPRYFIHAMDVAAERPPMPPPPDPDVNAPTAGGRYIVLVKQMPTGLREQAQWVSSNLTAFSVDANSKKVTAESASAALQAAQPWIRDICTAAEFKEGNLRLAGSFRDAGMLEEDPRHGLFLGLIAAGDVLRADAVRLWTLGQRDAALDRLAAAVGISRHLGAERYLLMSQKIAGIQLRKCAELLGAMRKAAGKDGLPDSPALARAAAPLDPSDPVGIHRGWCEHALATIEFADKNCQKDEVGLPFLSDLATSHAIGDWITRFFEGVKTGKDVKEAGCLDPKDVARLSRELREKLGSLTPVQVRAIGDRARPMVDELDKAWDGPDAPAVLTRISTEIDKDKTGIFTLILMYPRGSHADWARSVENAKEVGAGR